MRRRLILVTVVAGVMASAGPASAGHSWENWHWERSANPIPLTVLDSTTDTRTSVGLGQNWPAMLTRSASEWSQSTVLDLGVRAQTADDLLVQQACPLQRRAIRVCNVFNPDVTWLGLAVVLSDPESGSGHLLAAIAQMNDAWFSTGFYSALNAQHVICQEIGHTLGLDHQSEKPQDDLNTCMDYARALDNPSPNSHDYQQLQTIYQHLDGSGGGKGGGGKGDGGKPDKGGNGNNGGGGKSANRSGAWTPASLNLPAGYHGRGNHGGPHSEVIVTEENGHTVVRRILWAY